MVVYNFKKIQVVPKATELIDIVLSMAQKKTPTVVHKQYAITRIRSFYMRKVKFVQQTFHDRLTTILEEFPVLDDLHPFYGDLLNVLYDRDHYKLALAQLNTARHLVDNVGQEHVRFLKYGDSMYRCKQLKVAALGRMCTIIKQQASSFAYLEEVRQHLARLPSIDPSTRTLIMTGYPNVGKSSLMNKLTRANVDVQPYAFTTKSLFVGHMDYKYLKWQVLDTPGILDHPLEERNTIEMQAVTALAHLHATVMFLLDISETCNYTIKEQVGLFHSLRPLFANKPLLLVLTKIDLQKYEDLDEEDRKMIEDIKGLGVTVMELSSASEIGIAKVKEQACDMLLAVRTEAKLKIHQNDESILSRLHLAVPKKRDNIERPPVTIERKKKSAEADDMEDEETLTFSVTPGSRDREQALLDEEKWKRGELPWSEYMKERERFLLANPEWKYDVIPEIMDGKNILDFVDPDIEAKLKALEEEENERLVQLEEELKAEGGADELNPEEAEKLEKINRRRVKAKLTSSLHYNQKNKAFIKKAAPEAGEAFASHLESLGIDREDARGVAKRAADAQVGMAKVAATKLAKRSRRGEDSGDSSDDTELPEDLQRVKRIRRELSTARERSLSRSQVRKLKREEEEIKNKPQPGSGFKDASSVIKAKSLSMSQMKLRNRQAPAGEADHRIPNMMPKHLFSGKLGRGKRDRR